eukprot:jgi/Tetstr1/465021/TSEL_009749.t1
MSTSRNSDTGVYAGVLETFQAFPGAVSDDTGKKHPFFIANFSDSKAGILVATDSIHSKYNVRRRIIEPDFDKSRKSLGIAALPRYTCVYKSANRVLVELDRLLDQLDLLARGIKSDIFPHIANRMRKVREHAQPVLDKYVQENTHVQAADLLRKSAQLRESDPESYGYFIDVLFRRHGVVPPESVTYTHTLRAQKLIAFPFRKFVEYVDAVTQVTTQDVVEFQTKRNAGQFAGRGFAGRKRRRADIIAVAVLIDSNPGLFRNYQGSTGTAEKALDMVVALVRSWHSLVTGDEYLDNLETLVAGLQKDTAIAYSPEEDVLSICDNHLDVFGGSSPVRPGAAEFGVEAVDIMRRGFLPAAYHIGRGGSIKDLRQAMVSSNDSLINVVRVHATSTRNQPLIDEVVLMAQAWTKFFSVCETKWKHTNIAFKHRALAGGLPRLPSCFDMLRVQFELDKLWERAESLYAPDDRLDLGAAQILHDACYWEFVTTLVLRSGQVAKILISSASLESLEEDIQIGRVAPDRYTVVISAAKTRSAALPSTHYALPRPLSVLLFKYETRGRPVLLEQLRGSPGKQHDGLFVTHSGLALCETLERGYAAGGKGGGRTPAKSKNRYRIDRVIAGVDSLLVAAAGLDTRRYMGRLKSHTNCRTSFFNSSTEAGHIMDMLARGEQHVRRKHAASGRQLDAHLAALPQYENSPYDLPAASKHEVIGKKKMREQIENLCKFAMSSIEQMDKQYTESIVSSSKYVIARLDGARDYTHELFNSARKTSNHRHFLGEEEFRRALVKGFPKPGHRVIRPLAETRETTDDNNKNNDGDDDNNKNNDEEDDNDDNDGDNNNDNEDNNDGDDEDDDEDENKNNDDDNDNEDDNDGDDDNEDEDDNDGDDDDGDNNEDGDDDGEDDR